METITIKYNKRTNAGKAVEALLKILVGQKGIEIVQEESPYDPEFVKKIQQSEKRGDYIEVNPKNVWASIK